MNELKLISPNSAHEEEMKAYVAEFANHGETTINGSNGLNRFENYRDWLDHLKKNAKERVNGRFTSETFLVQRVVDGKIVGTVDVRHSLNENEHHVGHVGGSVLPSERGKGYGTEMTRLAILKAIEFGNKRVFMSCNSTNAASKKMIENNGMVFEYKHFVSEDESWLVYSKDCTGNSRLCSE